MTMADTEIEELVIEKIRRRRDAGRAKYVETMERTDLSLEDWLRHAQEEAMDLSIYLERSMRDVRQAVEMRKKMEQDLHDRGLLIRFLHNERDTAVNAMRAKEEDLERRAHELSPSMVQARNDQLNAENAALRQRIERLVKAGAAMESWCMDQGILLEWWEAKEAKP